MANFGCTYFMDGPLHQCKKEVRQIQAMPIVLIGDRSNGGTVKNGENPHFSGDDSPWYKMMMEAYADVKGEEEEEQEEIGAGQSMSTHQRSLYRNEPDMDQMVTTSAQGIESTLMVLYGHVMCLTPLNFTKAKFQGKISLLSCFSMVKGFQNWRPYV